MAERFSGVVLRRDPDGNALPPPTMGEIGLNHFAPYLMNRVVARWNSNMSEELREYDLSTAKMRTLAVLSVSSSLTINELSVFSVIEQSTMSRTLDSLEDQGYIRRTPRPEDMRIRDVTITEAGRDAFASFWPTMYDSFMRMFDGIDEEEYRVFTATLHKILLNIRKHEI
ncbi:MarR family transcriptional regulator [Neorhizobium sp. SOG26]|jgi:Transcriptional regulators|uniref:MarR family winged helix-turn-helix transcriptional regulator n=1 Tax=Neorhizobium sp. SOG26 TaxID=2060726 RepID=UPI000E5747A9|nr:MarR family transcriptional regulator [Neorhizobium sp. SOG26]AXV16779.1 MarR family transcriptional regulator [Neorhizobium sp. SOG26]